MRVRGGGKGLDPWPGLIPACWRLRPCPLLVRVRSLSRSEASLSYPACPSTPQGSRLKEGGGSPGQNQHAPFSRLIRWPYTPLSRSRMSPSGGGHLTCMALPGGGEKKGRGVGLAPCQRGGIPQVTSEVTRKRDGIREICCRFVQHAAGRCRARKRRLALYWRGLAGIWGLGWVLEGRGPNVRVPGVEAVTFR